MNAIAQTPAPVGETQGNEGSDVPPAPTQSTPVAKDPAAPAGEPAEVPATGTPSGAVPAAAAERSPDDDLKRRVQALEEELSYLREDLENARHVEAERERSTVDVRAYLDVGFFYVNGNGSGVRPDIGHRYLPEYPDVSDSWVFMGDPLSTAVNARGEPADTGESRAVTFDSLDAGEHPTFVLNSFGLNVAGSPGENVFAEALVDFVPRVRDSANPDGLFLGDFVDVKLAFGRYTPDVAPFGLELYAGKIEPVFGIEYRRQDAPDRLTVTPSLICRYTCGRPIGLKARAFLPGEALVLAAAVTNGSSTSELFPFYDEVDSNGPKTLSGRLSSLVWPAGGLELGVSAMYGAQDAQDDADVTHWQLGADARLDWRRLTFMAEFVKGNAEGRTTPGEEACDAAPCIEYMGAYGLLGFHVFPWLTPYIRADFRDATHEDGANFVYVSKLLRATGGANFRFGSNVILKAEYTENRELKPIPQFDNNVFTSSLVLRM